MHKLCRKKVFSVTTSPIVKSDVVPIMVSLQFLAMKLMLRANDKNKSQLVENKKIIQTNIYEY